MRLILFVIVFLIGVNALPQDFMRVDSVQKIQLDGGAFYPVLSDDGSRIAIRNYANRGLVLYDLLSSTADTIESVDMFIKQIVFSANGDTLYYTRTTPKGDMSLVAYPLSKRAGELSLGDQLVSWWNDLWVEEQEEKMLSDTIPMVNGYLNYPFLTLHSGRIIRYKDSNVMDTLNPLDVRYYLNPSLSPSGKNMVAFAVHKGCFVSSLDGKNIDMIERIEAPAWYSDDVIIGMVSEEDGHEVQSSAIVAYNLQNKQFQFLLPYNSLASHPVYNAACNKIICHSASGHLYIIHLAD